MSTRLTELLATTYRRSDIAYRLSLVREYAEYVLFTLQSATLTTTSVDAFCAAKEKEECDGDFLKQLSPGFFADLTTKTLYTELDAVRAECERLPTLSLVVPVGLTPTMAAHIGAWVRHTLAPTGLIEVSVDPSVVAGCRVVWQNQRTDLSYERAVIRRASALQRAIHGRMQATV